MHEYDEGFILDKSYADVGLLEKMDRVWLEQRLRVLESESYEGKGVPSAILQVGHLFQEIERKDGLYSVHLIEASQGAWILQTPPFPWTSVAPKDNEIFRLTSTPRPNPNLEGSKYLGTFTPYQPSLNSSALSPTIGRKRGTQSLANIGDLSARPYSDRQDYPSGSIVKQQLVEQEMADDRKLETDRQGSKKRTKLSM